VTTVTAVNAKDEVIKIVNTLHQSLFKASGGRIGGRVSGMPALILHTTGRKSGQKRSTMLTAPIAEDDRVVVVASYGGDDREPTWSLNLRANPEVEITMGGATKPMTARIAAAEERAELWPRVTATSKNYADYQTKTTREIPLVILTPR
jgi:deazaflavin-dependent oxidoreductase (nitroreductase family)